MRNKILTFLFVTTFSSLISQVNLVPNPSFEQLDSCVAQFQNIFIWPYMQIQLASPWDTLKSGGGGNPILMNSCFNPNPNIGVPKNLANASGCTTVTGSYQVPKSGVGYLYLAYFKQSPPNVAWRGYAQVKLTQTLTAGEGYCVTYHASLSNRATVAIDELSAYLDDGSLQSVAPMKEALATPQIKSPTGVFCTDTLNWTKVQGSFTATGNESYITLGNFRTPAATNYTTFCGPNGVAEYYVDDVSVIPINLSAYTGPDKNIFLGDSAFIGRPPEIGLECIWYNGTVTVGTGGGIWVKPTVTSTYVVQQNICGIIKTDTVKVTVDYVGVKETSILHNSFRLFPQPASDKLNIKIQAPLLGQTFQIKIFNSVGILLKDESISFVSDEQPLDISDLSSGFYFVQITNGIKTTLTKKIIVTR